MLLRSGIETNIVYNKNINDKCYICMEPITNNKIITDCSHNFHALCIHKWINIPNNNYNNCPVCRQNIDNIGNYLNVFKHDKTRIWYINVDPPYWMKQIRIQRALNSNQIVRT